MAVNQGLNFVHTFQACLLISQCTTKLWVFNYEITGDTLHVKNQQPHISKPVFLNVFLHVELHGGVYLSWTS